MSVQSEITRLITTKSDIATAITNKGVTVPPGTKLDGMAALIDSIESGGGSSVSVNTGTVLVNINEDGKSGIITAMYCTCFYNGEITVNEIPPNQFVSAESSNVLDNSILCFMIRNDNNYYTHSFNSSGVELIGEFYTSNGYYSVIIFKKMEGDANIYVK